MRKGRGRGSRTALAALALLLQTSCSFARSGESRETVAPTTSTVGDAVPTPSTSDAGPPAGGASAGEASPDVPPAAGDPTGEAPATDGEFDVVVLGPDGVPRPGVPATVTGPKSFGLTSGAGGRLRYRGPAGHYEIRIEPTCGDVIQVQTGAVGRVAVAADGVARGTLSVAWRHRFAPGAPVSYQDAEHAAHTGARGRRWPVGTPYVVQFAVVDRCSDARAPGARFPTFRFATNPEVDLEAAAPVADDRGYGYVRLTCRAPVSVVDLTATNSEAPEDAVDLFARAALDDSPPECV